MNEQRRTQTGIGQWIKKAEHDLINAEYVLRMEANCPTDTVCYHCHQCVEKYLKALLIAHNTPFPRTHDLVLLLKLGQGHRRIFVGCGAGAALESVCG